MAHHWRASDNLEHSFRPGEWRLYDRGQLLGYIQFGRINGRSGLRGTTAEGTLLGYAWTLEEACDRMWDWHVREKGIPAVSSNVVSVRSTRMDFMTDATTTTAPTTPEERLATYHSRRELAVVQPTGSLALVNTQWIDSEQAIYGVPGRWAPLPAGQSGLKVIAEASDGITVDGTLVDGEAIVRGKDDANPSTVTFSDTVTGFVIAGDDSYALRVWDSNSEDIQQFGGIDAYGYNPEWVITAQFTENPAGTTMGFEHLKDNGKTKEQVIPGEITFSKDGVDYNLAAFKSGRALQLVFADATNGVDTYSVGRFLFLAPNPDGSITLDFNLAVLPPCAFSYNFNCPLPPKQNRFAVAIEAGEKNVLKKDGTLLHG